jgi:DNA-binding MarR family transcriptional regulator
VIETVIRLEQMGQNTMTAIAEQLNITVGALSTAVQTLIGKGYLQRSTDANDRRLVLMTATNSGYEVNRIHESFHEQMINYVAQQMNAEDLARLTRSLEQLSLFFESLTKK